VAGDAAAGGRAGRPTGRGLVLAGYREQRVSASIDDLIAGTAIARLSASGVQLVLTALQAAETGQRGFLLTGRPSGLDPCAEAVGRVGPLTDQVVQLGQRSPWLTEDASLLRTVTGRTMALDLVPTESGRIMMDEARSIVARIRARIVAWAETERARLVFPAVSGAGRFSAARCGCRAYP